MFHLKFQTSIKNNKNIVRITLLSNKNNYTLNNSKISLSSN